MNGLHRGPNSFREAGGRSTLRSPRNPIAVVLLALAMTTSAGTGLAQATSDPAARATPSLVQSPAPLNGRIVAVGIPGVGAISPVGTFPPGGPIHDRAEFAAFTAPGQTLDPERILV